jgi:hypothetical protein
MDADRKLIAALMDKADVDQARIARGHCRIARGRCGAAQGRDDCGGGGGQGGVHRACRAISSAPGVR